MINKFLQKIKVHNYKKGFTLMETLVAIFILTLALTGPLTIAQKGLQTALISRDQDTAFYLAQDAIEYLRYARDTNCLAYSAANSGAACPVNNSAWLDGNSNAAQTINLAPCVSANGTAACTVDELDGTVPAACSGTCPALNYDPTENIYTYLTGTASIFTRTIQITSPVCASGGTPCNNNEAAIVVTVGWSDPLPHTITVNEDLLDWQ